MTRTLRARAAAVLGSATLIAASLLGGASALAAAEPLQLDHGHIDLFNLHPNDDGSVGLNLKEDVTGQHVPHEPGDFELMVKADAYVTNLPAGAVPPGVPTDAVYFLPISQDHNLVWPGWDSLQLQDAYGANLKSEIRVLDVDGPGKITVWNANTFGGYASLMKDGAFQFPGTITQDIASHVHANWAFTEPGTYRLQVQASVTSADGARTSTSETETYTITVRPAPESVSITGAEQPVAAGSEVTLSAKQAPETAGFTHYRWESRSVGDGKAGAAEWQPAGDDASITVTAAADVEYRVTVSGGKDYGANGAAVEVVSDPVRLNIAAEPTMEPSDTAEPTAEPTAEAPGSTAESPEPTIENPEPTTEPTDTAEPTPVPTAEPTGTAEPTDTAEPTAAPTGGPTASATSDPDAGGSADDQQNDGAGSGGAGSGGSDAGGSGQAPAENGSGDASANNASADGTQADDRPASDKAASDRVSAEALASTGAQPLLPIAGGAVVLAAAGLMLLRGSARFD